MKTSPTRFLPCAALAALLLVTGCRSVHEGPIVAPDPNAAPTIIGKEPAPAPIPQKDNTGSGSPLEHKSPDQRIDQPKG